MLSELQIAILKHLDEASPEEVEAEDLHQYGEPDACNKALIYLHGHGLIDGLIVQTMGSPRECITAKITSEGQDAVSEDGGYTAQKQTVTIRLEQDTIRELLLAKAAMAELPEQQRSKLKAAIANLPAETLKALTLDLLRKGVAQLPDAIQLIGRACGLPF